MRDIAGIDRVLEILEPHWAEVEGEFERVNREFLRLAAIDHEPIGRVLRAHLVIENFLTAYLGRLLGADSVRAARLTFAQKVSLLPNGREGAAFVK